MTDETSTTPGPEPVVLVAEDEESVRSMVELLLRTRGYRAILCVDGQDALERLEAGTHVDAVLLDIRMPRMTGVELVERIRGRAALRTLPVIAMSAYNDERQEREVIAAGADAFLAKPFTVRDLTGVLERFVRTSERGTGA